MPRVPSGWWLDININTYWYHTTVITRHQSCNYRHNKIIFSLSLSLSLLVYLSLQPRACQTKIIAKTNMRHDRQTGVLVLPILGCILTSFNSSECSSASRHVEQLSQQLRWTEATLYDSHHHEGIEICSTIFCNSILIYLFQFSTNLQTWKALMFLPRLQNHFFVLERPHAFSLILRLFLLLR